MSAGDFPNTADIASRITRFPARELARDIYRDMVHIVMQTDRHCFDGDFSYENLAAAAWRIAEEFENYRPGQSQSEDQ